MAHVQALDEMIKEYLLFRGLGNTVKVFDVDLKSDKERGFRVDKIIDQLSHFIYTYDLHSLREMWSHLDTHMFCKLENHFASGVKKLEYALLKMYLVNASVNNKSEKINEFFTKLTPELQGSSEWRDWFMFPYTKNPEEHPIFSLHFTKQWQDTLLVSLHNFLASIFQYMPTPTLMHFEEDSNKIRLLEEKNESLRKRLVLLIDRGPEANVTPCPVEPPQHLLDDFYIIAQESAGGGASAAESQAKSFKSLIRNMSSGSSPILGRKDHLSLSTATTTTSSSQRKRTQRSGRPGQSYFYDS